MADQTKTRTEPEVGSYEANEKEIKEANVKVGNAETKLTNADAQQEKAIAEMKATADQSLAKAKQMQESIEGANAEAAMADQVGSNQMPTLGEIYAAVTDEIQLKADTTAQYAESFKEHVTLWGKQIEKGVSDLADASSDLWDAAKGSHPAQLATIAGVISGAANMYNANNTANAVAGYVACENENVLDAGVDAKAMPGVESVEDIIVMVEDAKASEDGGNSDVDSSGESSSEKEAAEATNNGTDPTQPAPEKHIEADEEYQDPQQSKDEIDLNNPANNDAMITNIIKEIQTGMDEGKSATTIISEMIEDSSAMKMFESTADVWKAAMQGDYSEAEDLVKGFAENGGPGAKAAADIMLSAGAKLFGLRDQMDAREADASQTQGEVDLTGPA